MSRPLEVLPEAADEVAEGRRWYLGIDASVATRFEREVRSVLAGVTAMPELLMLRTDGTRQKAVRGFPYVVVYVVEPARVLVVAVAHVRRQSGYWRSRI